MTVTLVDPTLASAPGTIPIASRPLSLDGLTLGLIDNGKTHGKEILERVAERLGSRHRLAGTRYLRKRRVNVPPDPGDVEAFAEECGAILAAIGD